MAALPVSTGLVASGAKGDKTPGLATVPAAALRKPRCLVQASAVAALGRHAVALAHALAHALRPPHAGQPTQPLATPA